MKAPAPLLNYNLEQLKYFRDVYSAQLSLYEFFKQAWHVVEPGVPFKDNWHLKAIADHLEACYRRQIKKLVINVPPRSGKTTLISIIFPAWVWLQNPSEKFLYASYALSLSTKHGSACLKLIQSSWYQQRWGHLFKLTESAKKSFGNDKMGVREATSIGGVGTGAGGSMVIVDDPNNVQDGESEAVRDSTNFWWNTTLPSRKNDQENDVIILVQQRTSDTDVTGDTIRNDINKKWVYLILPMEFEENRRAKTILLNGEIWQDPRQEEGELLCEARWSKDTLIELKNQLGEYGYAGQFQQRPSPKGGGLIKKHWFKWWKESTPPKIEFILQSWDTALTDKKTSSYYACTTWGVFLDDNKIENVILLSIWRGRVGYPEAREMAKRLYRDYRDNGKEHNPAFQGRLVDLCLIEAKASGEPLIQDLAVAGIRAFPFNPTKYKDKTNRVNLVSHLIESGCVWVRASAPHYDRLMPEADQFVEACAMFPKGESLDLVDTMTQALAKLKENRLIQSHKDERHEPYYEERDIEY